MSTIKVDTYLTRGGVSEIAIDKLKGASSASSISVVGEGGSTTTNLQQGLAKVWLFASSGNSISDSLNMTSITDNGTSDNTYNIANDFANSTFSVGSIFGQSGHGGFLSANMFAVTTGSIRTSVYLDGNSLYEASLQCYTIHGDLA